MARDSRRSTSIEGYRYKFPSATAAFNALLFIFKLYLNLHAKN